MCLSCISMQRIKHSMPCVEIAAKHACKRIMHIDISNSMRALITMTTSEVDIRQGTTLIHVMQCIPVDRTDTGNIFLIANAFRQQAIADLPCKHRRIFSLIFTNGIYDFWRGNLGFGAPDDTRFNGPCFIIPVKAKDWIIDEWFIYLPVDRGDAGDIVLRAHTLSQEAVTDFPSKHGRVLQFVFSDCLHHCRCGNFRLWSPDHTWLDGPSLIIPVHNDELLTWSSKQLSLHYTYRPRLI